MNGITEGRRRTALPRIIQSVVALLAGAALLLSVQPVAAHGYIVRAIPPDRAVLDRAPTRLQYWFSEALEPKFSTISVRDSTGKVLAAGGVDAQDNTLMSVRLPKGLPDGAYIVDLRPAFAEDGHAVAESRVFFVGKEVSGVAGAQASNQAVPLEVVWRTLVLFSTMLLFGAFSLYTLVLVPAWGSPQYRAGFLPPRVMARLNGMVIVGLVMAFAAQFLALVQQTMVYFGVDAGTAISQGLWNVVLIGSRFGDFWNIRLILLALVALLFAASLYLRRSYPETVSAFWSANAWVMALIAGTLSVASHAAGSLVMPWVAVAMDWLHASGVALWAGGLAALVLVLPVALKPYSGDQRRQALLAVLRRFSRLAAACVFIVITTGIYSALNWLYTPADLTQTSYGDALLLKGLLVVLLLGVGAVHYAALHPDFTARMERRTAFLRGLAQGIIRLAEHLNATLRLEVILVAVVLAAVSLLSATPPPAPDFLQTSAEALHQTQTVDGLTVSVTLTPGGPGVNTVDTLVSNGSQPVENVAVRFQMVNPARDWRSPWHTAENADTGLYVSAGDDIDRFGQWWMVMNLTHGDGKTSRVAFDWTITEATAIVAIRAPTLANWLALLAVGAALLWAAYPALKRYYERLDLSPKTLLIAFGATVISLALLGIMSWGVQDAQNRQDAILHPLPSVVNPTLPDAASIERGQALYTQYCLRWQSVGDDFVALRDSEATLRDDVLYTATLKGWRDLPPCDGDLSAVQRWDIVNFFRTLDKSTEIPPQAVPPAPDAPSYDN